MSLWLTSASAHASSFAGVCTASDNPCAATVAAAVCLAGRRGIPVLLRRRGRGRRRTPSRCVCRSTVPRPAALTGGHAPPRLSSSRPAPPLAHLIPSHSVFRTTDNDPAPSPDAAACWRPVCCSGGGGLCTATPRQVFVCTRGMSLPCTAVSQSAVPYRGELRMHSSDGPPIPARTLPGAV